MPGETGWPFFISVANCNGLIYIPALIYVSGSGVSVLGKRAATDLGIEEVGVKVAVWVNVGEGVFDGGLRVGDGAGVEVKAVVFVTDGDDVFAGSVGVSEETGAKVFVA